MRKYLNESEAIDFIRPLGKGEVIRRKLDVDNGDGEIEILWKKRNQSISLWVSFYSFNVEEAQVDVAGIDAIYAVKSERNICLPFFEYMSQDGDVLGTDVWDALEDLGYIK